MLCSLYAPLHTWASLFQFLNRWRAIARFLILDVNHCVAHFRKTIKKWHCVCRKPWRPNTNWSWTRVRLDIVAKVGCLFLTNTAYQDGSVLQSIHTCSNMSNTHLHIHIHIHKSMHLHIPMYILVHMQVHIHIHNHTHTGTYWACFFHIGLGQAAHKQNGLSLSQSMWLFDV